MARTKPIHLTIKAFNVNDLRQNIHASGAQTNPILEHLSSSPGPGQWALGRGNPQGRLVLTPCPPLATSLPTTRSRRNETELVQLLVESHAADAQLRRGAEAVIAVPLQRGGDLGPFDFVLGRGQCR